MGITIKAAFFQDDIPYDKSKYALSEETKKYFQEGMEEPDNLKAVQFLEKAAAGGHPLAMHTLGNVYQFVIEDKTAAREWYAKGADLGLCVSQYNLGLMCVAGAGGEVDMPQAFDLYTKAAEQGFAAAQHNLAWMYSSGEGAEVDHKKAFEWYLKAAEQDDSKAQHNIANYYIKGKYVEKDVANAIEWYERSAKLGNTGSQLILGMMYRYGEEVEQNDEKAFNYFSKAVSAQYLPAYTEYAVMLVEAGKPKKAKKLLLTAAIELNDIDAYYYLGVLCMEEGKLKQALSYLKVAADDGDERAIVKMGHVAEQLGNTKLALKCYERVSANAQWNLGLLYEDLPEHKDDLEKIRNLFEQAAAQDHNLANRRLGEFYLFGQGGVEQEVTKAIEYLEKAYQSDEALSACYLGQIYLGSLPGTEAFKDEERGYKYLISGAKEGAEDCIELLKTLPETAKYEKKFGDNCIIT